MSSHELTSPPPLSPARAGRSRPELPRTGRRAPLLLAILLLAAPAGAADRYVLSIGSTGTVCDFDDGCVAGLCASNGAVCASDLDCPRCFQVQNEDLVQCEAVSLGENNTQCRWSLFFDGSSAGLSSKVLAVDVLPDGSLVMAVAADGSVPDISGIKRKDLALFSPTDALGNPTPFQIPYTQGQWRLFLDGDAVKSASDARIWNSVEVLFPQSCRDRNGDQKIEPQECDVLLSLSSGGSLGLPPNQIFPKDEDIVRCRPTLSPGGTISSCDYSMFLDSSQINEPSLPGPDPSGQPDSFTTNLLAIELPFLDPNTLTGTLLFRVGGGATLPPHQSARDLLRMDGSFGPTGACSVTSARRCLADDDCPAGETCGAFDANPATFVPTRLVFDGDLPGARVVPDFSAGLGGETIQAFAVVPDGDGDQVPDGIDNCPLDPNPVEICRHTCDPGSGTCSDGTTSCSSDADCPFSTTTCTSDAECPLPQRCAQADDDLDGVGNVCDQCNGRDDALCRCGDFVVDFPSELCDLGDPLLFPGTGFNGVPGSPCSSDCKISGSCTQTPGAQCTTAADCGGVGEGCCGNGVVEGRCSNGSGSCQSDADCRSCSFGLCADGVTACTQPSDCLETCQPGDEQCDDGNPIDDDRCRNDCTFNAAPVPLPPICEGLHGPNIIPALVRSGVFVDTRRVPGTDFDRWRVRGEFSLPDGAVFDPDQQQVDLVFSQDGFLCAGGTRNGFPCAGSADCPGGGQCRSPLFQASLRPGDGDAHFIQLGPAQDRPVWRFRNKLGDNLGAESWKMGRLFVRNKSKRRPLNQIKFNLWGQGDKVVPQVSFPIDPTLLGGPPPRVRETLRVGDVCASQVMTCDVKGGGKRLRCFSLVGP